MSKPILGFGFWPITFIGVVLVGGEGNASAQPAVTQAAATPPVLTQATPVQSAKPPLKPELRIDPPPRAEVGVPFTMPVTYYVPRSRTDLLSTPFEVTGEHNGVVAYKPWRFKLRPNETREVSVTISHNPSGLAEILMISDCCENPHIALDTGFRGRVIWQRDEPLESQMRHWASLTFVDNTDRPMALDAPLSIRVDAANALIRRAGDRDWSSKLEFETQKGSTDTGPLEVYPTLLTGGRGTLQIRGFLSQGGAMLFDAPLTFTILPPIWMRLLMTIIGALLYSLYRLSKSFEDSWSAALTRAVGSAIFAGVFAWAFADLNIVGIKTDSTRLTGYFVLGLLTSYAGIEPLFEKLAKRHSAETDESAAAHT